MSNKKWAVRRYTLNLSNQENQIIERYQDLTGRPFTDIMRELIRGLGDRLTQAEQKRLEREIHPD